MDDYRFCNWCGERYRRARTRSRRSFKESTTCSLSCAESLRQAKKRAIKNGSELEESPLLPILRPWHNRISKTKPVGPAHLWR